MLVFTSDIVLVVDLIPTTTFVISRDYSVTFQTLALSDLLRRVFLTVRILFPLIGGFVLELLWCCLLGRNYFITELSDLLCDCFLISKRYALLETKQSGRSRAVGRNLLLCNYIL